MSPTTSDEEANKAATGVAGLDVETGAEQPSVMTDAGETKKNDDEGREQPANSENQQVPGSVINGLDAMKDAVFFLHPNKKDRLSSFWLLLIFAAIIATSGVLGDSPATVIGAMIVAPLMIPILGLMLSTVLIDGPNFRFSLLLLVSGISCCVFIGFILGFFANDEIFSKENNSQVAARVSPKISDLLGALATGAVGAISLVRKDIAGALPGVAISISLVPPLCVVGLTLSSGEFQDAFGAMLLFLCNFMSIQVTGVIIMYIYGVQKMARHPRARLYKTVVLVLFLMLCLIALPLGVTSYRLAEEKNTEKCVRDAIQSWAEPQGWETRIVVARTRGNQIDVSVIVAGEPPFPDETELDGGMPLKEACPTLSGVDISFFPVSTFVF